MSVVSYSVVLQLLYVGTTGVRLQQLEKGLMTEILRRRRTAAETRLDILNAAVSCFQEKGYAGTTFDHVAQRLKVSRSAVVWYFRSKQDLVDALVEPLLTSYASLIREAEADADGADLLLTGIIDLYVEHRRVVQWLLLDVSAYGGSGPMGNVGDLDRRARDVLAPTSDVAGQVVAAAAMGALGRPLLVLPDVDLSQQREVLLIAARRTLGLQHRT